MINVKMWTDNQLIYLAEDNGGQSGGKESLVFIMIYSTVHIFNYPLSIFYIIYSSCPYHVIKSYVSVFCKKHWGYKVLGN